ncbi:MAG: hypothetical protein IKN54_08465 [Lachnospiraceae bacterium]|nr:hypothetical protein [Lachnospiraceae bacterium]
MTYHNDSSENNHISKPTSLKNKIRIIITAILIIISVSIIFILIKYPDLCYSEMLICLVILMVNLILIPFLNYLIALEKVLQTFKDDYFSELRFKKIKRCKKVFIASLCVSAIPIVFLFCISFALYDVSQPVYKPVIYLYPTTETNVDVSLGFKDNIIVSYPEYTDGWHVAAKPDGDLKDLDTGKDLYSLYYENESSYNFQMKDDGFVVAGNDIAEFLDEKLEILGLNYKEREEFIIYWLPVLKENKYNYIRFATADEIEQNMPLNICPAPDTVIRVIMTFKELDKPIDVTEQKLYSPERKGFTAVEWGGTEIQ